MRFPASKSDTSAAGHDIGFGIGVAHEFATLGTISFEGSFDYPPSGRCPMSHPGFGRAKPGQVLISPRVLMAVKDAVTVDLLGSLNSRASADPSGQRDRADRGSNRSRSFLVPIGYGGAQAGSGMALALDRLILRPACCSGKACRGRWTSTSSMPWSAGTRPTGTLLREPRRALHARIAETLES